MFRLKCKKVLKLDAIDFARKNLQKNKTLHITFFWVYLSMFLLLTYNIINAWLLLHFRFNLFKVLVINYLIYCHKCLNESPFCVLALTYYYQCEGCATMKLYLLWPFLASLQFFQEFCALLMEITFQTNDTYLSIKCIFIWSKINGRLSSI